MKRGDLPKRVYEKHGAWFLVGLDKKWHRLCRVRDGLPEMYRALSRLTDAEAHSDRMPAVVSRWLEAKQEKWAPRTRINMARVGRIIGETFADFTPDQVTTPVCAQFLRQFPPRTHNVYRNALSQVLAQAAIDGLREGYSPLDNIKGKSTPGRRREVLDSELQAIRAAAPASLVQMIDLALLTGQRIGDLIKLRWQDVTPEGIRFEQGKTKERLLVEWSPALQAAMPPKGVGFVLKTRTGSGYRYAGIRSAWVRVCQKCGIEDLHIHDLRGRAGVDSLLAGNMAAAQALLGHRTEAMTSHYVRGKFHKKVKASK
jgi:integrase